VHAGIVARFVPDGEYLAKLLPQPLEPSERTSEVSLFVNETVFAGVAPDLDMVEPSEARFREAILWISCQYQGVEYVWGYVQYITTEALAYSSNCSGRWTKLATIDLMFPSPPHPLHGEVEPGAELKATVTRLSNRIITTTFKVKEKVDPELVPTFHAPLVGMRYFPDHTVANRGNALVHDLVVGEHVEMGIAEAWSGDATVTFGRSEYEELYHFEPLRMLESYFINGFSYLNKGTHILHDYLAQKQHPVAAEAR
jgi:hypothetical protein